MTKHDPHIVAALSDGGFRSLGHFLVAVRAAAEGRMDPRLTLSPRAPTGLNENDPTAGGFMVPELFSERIVGSIYEDAVIAPLCDITETENTVASLKEPAFDETSRQDGSRWGGTLGYWLAEAAQVPLSKPKFRQNEFVGHKLVVLAYVTEELFSDAPMLQAHFERAARAEGSFKLDLSVLAGTGAGTPMGILNSPALITVPKEAGQTSGTITVSNVGSMWKRLPGPSRRRAVWLVNEDVEPQLAAFNFPGATTGNGVAYLPAGAAGNAFPLLKGRPVLEIEQASPLGQVGDIVLAAGSLLVAALMARHFSDSCSGTETEMGDISVAERRRIYARLNARMGEWLEAEASATAQQLGIGRYVLPHRRQTEFRDKWVKR